MKRILMTIIILLAAAGVSHPASNDAARTQEALMRTVRIEIGYSGIREPLLNLLKLVEHSGDITSRTDRVDHVMRMYHSSRKVHSGVMVHAIHAQPDDLAEVQGHVKAVYEVVLEKLDFIPARLKNGSYSSGGRFALYHRSICDYFDKMLAAQSGRQADEQDDNRWQTRRGTTGW